MDGLTQANGFGSVPTLIGDYAREHTVAVAAARRAGAVIQSYYRRNSTAARAKQDGSPVTEADLAADRLIRAEIAAAFPADALLTEEGADEPSRLNNRRCWIVDPLDGTVQFVLGTDDFDVFIALVVDGRPAVAAAAHPPSGSILSAVARAGAWLWEANESRDPSRVTLPESAAPPRLTTSKWYGGNETGQALARIARELDAMTPPVLEIGFTPRKLLCASRHYDAFIGLVRHWSQTPAGEWDIVAADLIVNEAGGRLSDLWGNPHRYNKPNPRVDRGLLISADPALHARLLAALRAEVDSRSG
jgi:3'-phosphoadenosine 5'-phosphosulfate (PAPS) 3'-phosphatase